MFGGVFPPVVAHLLADISEFAAKMGEAEAISDRVAGRTAGSFKGVAKEMMGIGGGMAVTAGLVGAETLHMAAGFDSMMERVHTQANASQAEVDGLKSKVLGLAQATGQGPEKLAEALYHVESVGYRGKIAMDVLTNAAKLSTISGADLDATTYGLTSVMQTFGAKAGEAAKYAALFNATVGAGDMQMEAFNRAVGTGFYSVAQTFGVSAQSASGALAFMTDRGAHADEAATRLRMTIALLAAPSQKSTAILKDLGLTSESVGKAHQTMNGILQASKVTYSQLATDLKSPDGFYVALKHLQKGLEDSGLSAEAANAQLSHAFGGGKSDASILAMLNNLDNLKSKYEAVGKGMGNYAESYTASQKTATNQMARFKATAESLGIEIGHALMPYALKLLGWLRDVASWIANHEGAVKALAFLIGVTFVTGLALATAGAIAFAAATVEIWGPIFLIIIGLMALVAAVIYVWTHWKQIWGWIVEHARSTWAAITGWVSRTWNDLKAKTSQTWDSIVAWLKQKWNGIASWFSTSWHRAVDPIVRAWNWLKSTTERVWDSITAWFKKWWPLLLVIFAPFIAVIVALWNHFHQQVWDTLVSWWNNITGWLSTAWDWIVSTAKTAWAWVQHWIVNPVVTAAQTVWRWIMWIKDRVVAGFNTVVGWVRTGWHAFYTHAVKPVTDAATAIWHGMQTVYKNVTGWFQSVLDWAGGLWNSFYNIGSNIVNGIIQGVEDLAGQAWKTVTDFANGLLDAAKSFLGINSPSRLFREVVGRALPEGVAVGIKAHAHVAMDGVTGMAKDLVHAAKVAVSPVLSVPKVSNPTFALRAAQTGAGSAPLPVTVNVRAEVDGKALFEVTQDHSLQYERRNSRPAFSVG